MSSTQTFLLGSSSPMIISRLKAVGGKSAACIDDRALLFACCNYRIEKRLGHGSCNDFCSCYERTYNKRIPPFYSGFFAVLYHVEAEIEGLEEPDYYGGYKDYGEGSLAEVFCLVPEQVTYVL